MDRSLIEFIKAAVRHPLEVSTLFPTSPFLAERLLDQIEFKKDSLIIEVGAGTGAVTKYLSRRLLEPKTQYLGVEINPEMTDFLRQTYPHLSFRQGRVQDLQTILGPTKADAVVSSLPWTVFSSEDRDQGLRAIHDSLKPGGVFATYVCVNSAWYPQAKAFKNQLYSLFSKVEKTSIEWKNIPPAFVYRATK